MGNIKIVAKGVAEESLVDRQTRITWWSQETVSKARIAVIGAGAIGNEVLKNLALIGVGNIFICDMDRISTSNLSRTVLFTRKDVGQYKAEVAAERVREMSVCEDVQVSYYVGDVIHGLGNGIFRQFDVILGCLDNLETRMSVNKRCNLLQLPYLDGGIWELAWGLQVYHYPHSSCLACGISAVELARERGIRYSCDAKKRKFIEEKKAPTIQISTASVGAMQVQEAIKILHGMDVVYGRKYFFEGLNNNYEIIRIPSNPECLYHESYDYVEETDWTNQVTLEEFLEWVSAQNRGKEYYVDILFDYKFTTTGKCKTCGAEITFYQPDFLTYTEDFYCEECKSRGDLAEGFAQSEDLTELRGSDERIAHLTLEQLGIPKAHIVTVRNCEDETDCRHYELSQDIQAVLGSIKRR